MDKTKHEVTIQDRIAREMEALFPHGEGRASSARVKRSLESVAAVAFREGQSYALSSLMTIDDVARELGVSPRRAKAIAREMHDRYGVGWLAWLVRFRFWQLIAVWRLDFPQAMVSTASRWL